MNSKYIILFFSILQASQFVSGQVTQEWAARYHFFSEDEVTAIAIDNNGNILVTGRSEASTPSGAQPDYATIKYNSTGVQQWVKRYNGPGNNLDVATSIAVDNSGNVYVTGYSRSGPDAGYNDFATIKYNSTGAQLWVRRYDFGGSDIPCKVAIDAKGDIIIGGWGTLPGTGPDFAVIKYDTNGNILWVRTYDSGGSDNLYDYANAMAVDSFGSIILTGSFGLSTADWGTVKWNSQGVFQWAQRYNGPGGGSDYAKAISVSDSGNVYVTGYVWGNNHTDCAVLKYNSSGAQQWEVFYDNGFHDAASSVTVDDSENVYITGGSGNGSNYDFLTVKYNRMGFQQWTARFNGPSNSDDGACCIMLDTTGNVYITGYARVSTNNSDYCTIKYNNAGTQQWVIYYNGTGNSLDGAAALEIDADGNVIVTGFSRGPGNRDYATIKYSQLIGIIQNSSEIPKEYRLEQNYPNPFNPVTNIGFSIVDAGFVNLTVYDILGRKIETVINEELNAGTYEVEFKGKDYPSGVYFYNFKTLKFIETKKMILNK